LNQRVKLFSMSWGESSPATILKQLEKNQYNEEKKSGYFIDSFRDTSIVGRYVEKKEIEETIISPFGDETVSNRFWYETIAFKMQSNPGFLELTNPPRSVLKFLNNLAGFSDFGIVIRKKDINIVSFLEHFERQLESVQIRKINAISTDLIPSCSVKMEFKGIKDVRKKASQLIDFSNIEIDQVQIYVSLDNKTYVVEVNKSGILKLPLEVRSLVSKVRESVFAG